MIEVMMKVAAVGITAAVCAAVVRQGTPAFAMLLMLTAGVWSLLLVADGFGAVTAVMEELAQLAGLDRSVLEPVLKTVVISIITKLTVEVCRGAGEGGIAAFVETAGMVLALVVSLPLIQGVLTLMREMLL